MLKKILVANRGEDGGEADVAAKPSCIAHEARAGDADPSEVSRV